MAQWHTANRDALEGAGTARAFASVMHTQMMNKCHTRRSNCRLLRQRTMEESSCLFEYMATDVLEHWKKLQPSDTHNANARVTSV